MAFKDPWVPRPPSFKPITQGLEDTMKVSELIQQPGKWNDELIQQRYLIPDSELILSIPLSPFDHTYSCLWHYNSNENYSVKSGCNLAISIDRAGPSSSTDVISAWWKAFWAITIPRKILIFGWRGFHEILPTLKGLYRRNVSTRSNCPLCEFGEDSNAHAVFWCPISQKLWDLLDYPFMMGNKEEISFKGVLLYATELLEIESFVKMLIAAWGLWYERNKIIHGQQIRTPQQLKRWISSYYEDLKNALDTECAIRPGDEISHGRQADLQIHDLALFVDAEILTPTKMVGLGAVILTENKRVQAALSKPLKGSLSVCYAAALALLVGLCWAQNIGLPIRRISSDSLSLVQALQNSKVYHNELGILITDIKLLLTNFPEEIISHVRHNYNLEAHNLVKHAIQLDEESSWVEEIPHHEGNHL